MMYKKNFSLLIFVIIILSACTRENNLSTNKINMNLEPPGKEKSQTYLINQQDVFLENMIAEIPDNLINKNEQILQVINKNLDLDNDDEQVFIAKMTDDINTPLKIVVIDFDPVQGKPVRSWEYLTNSTNLRAFNLEFDDMIGDFNQEIIFTGANKKGETTFFIFKKIPSPSNLGLFYTPIFQIVTDGTIHINKITRSPLYQVGQKTGQSYPIVIEHKDKESSNSLDLIRDEYDWNYNKGLYELISSKPVPAEVVVENQLRALYDSNVLKDFENFISGPWYNKKDIKSIIVFAPEMEQIVFYSNDIQEIYTWDYMKKTVYNGLLFMVRNQSSSSIRKKINVTIKDTETITLNTNDINWDGTYIKVKEEFLESLFENAKTTVELADFNLTGFYEDENEEMKIIFEPPSFTMIKPGKENVIDGGFSITKNIPILNNYYLKRKLRKIPKQFSRDQFENEILKTITNYTAKKTLKDFYKIDSTKTNYTLESSELGNKELSSIWEILLSIQYKGYYNYQLAVLTLNIIDKNKIITRIDNYIMEYAEVHDENKVIKTIVLTPAEIEVKGIEATSDESLTFIQTEFLDN